MILVTAIAAGLAAGLVRAWVGRRRLAAPDLRGEWLVLVAFLPQFFVFYWPATQTLLSDQVVALSLVASQALLLVFAGLNYKQAGFFVLGCGLILNLLVIVLNGGLMPISPETAAVLAPDLAPEQQVGDRFGTSKDIILPVEDTRLWALSDRFLLPTWAPFPGRVAFSLGDVFIAAGAFWFCWRLGDAPAGKQSMSLSQDQQF